MIVIIVPISGVRGAVVRAADQDLVRDEDGVAVAVILRVGLAGNRAIRIRADGRPLARAPADALAAPVGRLAVRLSVKTPPSRRR